MKSPRTNVVEQEPKKRIAANGYRLPDPIREGEIFTDLNKKHWRLGRSIGIGGFGEIYLASNEITRPVGSDAKYVIKVEPHANGPLFVEMNFYLRVAKIEMIDSWVAKNELNALGMPYFVGAGSHMYRGEHYRFLIIPRFGDDLQKIFLQHRRRFHIKTALTLATYIINTLEYIHGCGYVHADIKPDNLLLGLATQAPVYLVDFGLACRYRHRSGRHKEYCLDERRAHYGTIEYTSRDAHIGAISRRGDLEILGYNLIHWLTGHLPWDDDLADPEAVAEKKKYAMENITEFLTTCFSPALPPNALVKYLQYVNKLNFHSQPDYKYCKKLFKSGIREAGYVDDNKLTFTGHSKLQYKKTGPKKRKYNFEAENKGAKKFKQALKINAVFGFESNRKPCAAQNFNRMTRNTVSTQSSNPLCLQNFNWAMVLAGHPEKKPVKRPENTSTSRTNGYPSRSDTEFSTNNFNDSYQSYPEDDDGSLDNPTPAMREVMARMKQRAREAAQASNMTTGNKRAKSESSRCSSPTECNQSGLTPAMEAVLMRRLSTTSGGRTTRSSSRRSPDVTKLKLKLAALRLNPVTVTTHQSKRPVSPQQKRSARLNYLKA